MRRFAVSLLFALLVVSLLAVPSARADHCRSVYYAPQYVAPTYQAYDYNQIVVAKAFQVQVAAPFYMGVADDYRQLNFAKQVAEEYAKIVEYQRQHLALNQQQPLGPSPGPGTLPLTTQQPTTKIGAILANRCIGCHSPGKQSPDLSGDAVKVPELVRLKCLQQLTLGKMPKGKPPLPQDEFNEVGAWSELKPAETLPVPIPPAKKEVLKETPDKK